MSIGDGGCVFGVGAVLEPGTAADDPRGCKTKDNQKNAHLTFTLASTCAPC